MFNDIRENGLGNLNRTTNIKTAGTLTTKETPKVIQQKPMISNNVPSAISQAKKGRPRKRTNPTPQVVRGLDLDGIPGRAMSLNEFMATKRTSSNVQITTLFIYYLEQILDIKDITIDHVFTCYKHMEYYIPKNLQQNLTDASSSKFGYINRRNSKYSITIIGINLVERDLN